MGAAKINTFPVILSISVILLVELAARKLNFSPLLVTGISRIIDICMVLLIFINFSSSGIGGLGLTYDTVWNGFKRGLLWSGIFGIIAAFVGLAFFLTETNPLNFFRVQIPKNEIALFFIVGGIIGPIAEEMVFRGVIYGYLRNLLVTRFGKYGIFFAVAFSTILFVNAHSVGSGIAFPQIVGGILFCLAFEVEKSLLVPIVIHSTGNTALFALSLMYH